ncbi:plasmid replication protein RepC [Rhodobacter sp. CZR27]|uniref:plasmid replication protein RepC n=1 Tax=Rhodobacter sp. CZR27 TaxID=2033869 RepID=UPI001E364A70|nr:plasmid replication protein RepC [Rhodobacter sp. CZR27]
MHHISLTPFGRQPVTAGILRSQRLAQDCPTLAQIDKWTLFNDLRTARARFGVTDRDLSVLYALLSFLPARSLSDEAPLVVFPSNASLSDRAHGMAESTLRRHLAALVAAGLVARRDSANGKRYAQRDRSGALSQAFGFDLRPLLVRAEEIAAAAAEVTAEAEALDRARTGLVLKLRDVTKLAAYAVETGHPLDLEPALAPIRRALRRRLDAGQIAQLVADLDLILGDIQARLFPSSGKTNASAVQNGRHHTNSNPDSPDLEPCQDEARGTGVTGGEPALPLALVLKACPDLAPYAPDIRSWRDLCGAAGQLRGMMGISPSAWEEAQAEMGAETAAIAVVAMLQRFASIRNPGGYLRSLSRRASEGAFSPGPMIMALLSHDSRRAA